MPAFEIYRAALAALPAEDWEAYLLAHSNLPGPRGNLELAAAVAEEGAETQFRQWAALGPELAPENTPQCFLAFCGVVGLGAVLARAAGTDEAPSSGVQSGETPPLQTLRALAADPRWRIREAVAMALQRWGHTDMDPLLAEMAEWAEGNPWEQRAVAAALCEPRLLHQPAHAAAVLRMLDEITGSIRQAADRKSAAFRTLRQGLAYCWSVAVAAQPDAGRPFMEKWLASPDPDIRRIMRENLKKKRLATMDPTWVAEMTGPGQ